MINMIAQVLDEATANVDPKTDALIQVDLEADLPPLSTVTFSGENTGEVPRLHSSHHCSSTSHGIDLFLSPYQSHFEWVHWN